MNLENNSVRCIVHQVRVCCKFVAHKDRKAFSEGMNAIYTSVKSKTGRKHSTSSILFGVRSTSMRSRAGAPTGSPWALFFKYSPEVRRTIYTTNAIESLNRVVRKITKTKSAFPSDDSLFKLLYLIVMDISAKWIMQVHNWGIVISQLSTYFGERLTKQLWRRRHYPTMRTNSFSKNIYTIA